MTVAEYFFSPILITAKPGGGGHCCDVKSGCIFCRCFLGNLKHIIFMFANIFLNILSLS